MFLDAATTLLEICSSVVKFTKAASYFAHLKRLEEVYCGIGENKKSYFKQYQDDVFDYVFKCMYVFILDIFNSE